MEKNINNIKESLKGMYLENEIDAFIHWIMSYLRGYSRMDIVLNKDKQLSTKETLEVERIVKRLQNKEPIQYILGETEFCGLQFLLTPDVLIPRPETEEIVEFIRDETEHSTLKILDIGTGSGCIPLALKNYFPEAQVSACDVSEKALNMARENGIRNKLLVNFFQYDILSKDYLQGIMFDMIVSNPPYVRQSEKQLMDDRVLKHEPHLALFVEDEDPLLFYRAILDFTQKHLKKGGRLYVEINEAMGDQAMDLMKKHGFENVIVRKDLQGRDRLVRGTSSSRKLSGSVI